MTIRKWDTRGNQRTIQELFRSGEVNCAQRRLINLKDTGGFGGGVSRRNIPRKIPLPHRVLEVLQKSVGIRPLERVCKETSCHSSLNPPHPLDVLKALARRK